MSAVLASISLASLPAIMMIAAISDWRTHRISNRLSVILVIGFAAAFFMSGLPLDALWMHLAVGFSAFLLGLMLFALRYVGGGDAKLFSAAALWMGWPDVIMFMGWMGVAGGVMAVMFLIIQKYFNITAFLPALIYRNLPDPEKGLPYGVAIAVGALVAFPATDLFRAVIG